MTDKLILNNTKNIILLMWDKVSADIKKEFDREPV